jgi:hypothetical protein
MTLGNSNDQELNVIKYGPVLQHPLGHGSLSLDVVRCPDRKQMYFEKKEG